VGRWIPADSEGGAYTPERRCFEPIGQIEHWVSSSSAPPITEFFTTTSGEDATDLYLQIDKPALSAILHSARNRVLRWALQLEKDGILGEGLTFTPSEQKAAASHNYGNVVHNTFNAPVGAQQLAQGSPHATQVAHVGVDPTALASLLKSLGKLRESGEIPEQDREQFNADLATVEAQAKAPKPKGAILRELLLSLRKVAEGVLTTQAVHAVKQIADILPSLPL
jgi:hypothetical protein